MANTLRKLNHLKAIESFVQVNFLKGFEYIDRAGALINKFYKDTAPPQFSVGLDGLLILNPNAYIEELKISADGYWIHSINPDSLDQVATWYLKHYDDIITTVRVEKINRVGWRNYFVHEYQNHEERERALRKLSLGDKLKNEGSIFSLELNGVTSNIALRRAIKNDNKKPVLFLDIDSFIAYETPNTASEAHANLTEIRKTIQSAEFLKQINLILN